MGVHLKITDKAPPRPEETERIKKEIAQTQQKEGAERKLKAH